MNNISPGEAFAAALISTLAMSSPATAQNGAATLQAGHFE